MGNTPPHIVAGRDTSECDPANSEPKKPNPKAVTAIAPICAAKQRVNRTRTAVLYGQ